MSDDEPQQGEDLERQNTVVGTGVVDGPDVVGVRIWQVVQVQAASEQMYVILWEASPTQGMRWLLHKRGLIARMLARLTRIRSRPYKLVNVCIQMQLSCMFVPMLTRLIHCSSCLPGTRSPEAR